jgi:hypothetical protein
VSLVLELQYQMLTKLNIEARWYVNHFLSLLRLDTS